MNWIEKDVVNSMLPGIMGMVEKELHMSMAAEIKRAVDAEYALRVSTINESYPAVKNAYDNYQSILMTKKEMIQAAWKHAVDENTINRNDLLDQLKRTSGLDSFNEEQLREDYPALKQAWDHYQTLLKIAIEEE